MTIELWNTLFSAATFVVIAVTAIAATIQLRHLRASNQLNALVTTLEDWQKPEMQAWAQYVRGGELSEKLKDPAYLDSLAGTINDRSLHPWRHIGDYFEQLGVYVKYGLVDKRSYLDVSSRIVLTLYEQMEPCIVKVREVAGSDAIYENFEYLAVLSVLWTKSHPNGAYPHGVPRFQDLKP